MDLSIIELYDENELLKSIKVIKESFMTVANEFKLTKENAPTNAAFIEFKDLIRMKEQGASLFGLYKQGEQIGFFTIESNQNALFYLNKLAILPEYRHHGYGGFILKYVFDYVQRNGGGKLSIGIINENYVLKKWYENFGFKEVIIKSYSHLPFEVCFMEKVFDL